MKKKLLQIEEGGNATGFFYACCVGKAIYIRINKTIFKINAVKI